MLACLDKVTTSARWEQTLNGQEEPLGTMGRGLDGAGSTKLVSGCSEGTVGMALTRRMHEHTLLVPSGGRGVVQATETLTPSAHGPPSFPASLPQPVLLGPSLRASAHHLS